MLSLLYSIPLFAIASAVFLYRLNGKKEFIKLDVVQFFYAFVMAPAFFVWIKSFLFIILRTEIDLRLSTTNLFVIDTFLSVLFLYVYGFVVIHALTKSFSLRRSRDPLYDIFAHSEFFHLWLTHLIVFVGTIMLIAIIATFNLLFPLVIEVPRWGFYLLSTSGLVTGVFFFLVVWLSDPKQDGANFMRLMKLLFGIYFLIHLVQYFLFLPSFSAEYSVYWWSLGASVGLVLCSLFVYRSMRAQTWFERISQYFKHHTWDDRVQLFHRK